MLKNKEVGNKKPNNILNIGLLAWYKRPILKIKNLIEIK